MKPIKAKDLLELDKRLEVVKLQAYPVPEQVIYQAGKADYSETPIHTQQIPPPQKCGEWIVDQLLGNERGHYGCYSSDTQVLTENGWLYWTEVTKNTALAAYDTVSGHVNYEIPTAIQKWEYSGKMYNLIAETIYKDTYINLLVSPDHRILYFNPDNSDESIKELTAKEFYDLDKSNIRFSLPRIWGVFH